MKKFKSLFVLAVLTLAVFIAYYGLWQTFFQQDEWQYFGAVIHAFSTKKPILNLILPFQGDLTHFYPLTMLFYAWEYLLFKTNFSNYAFMSLILHLINCLLLFYFIKLYLKNELIAFLASLFFSVNGLSHQAVSWILAGIGTLPGTAFILLSLIFFTKYLHFPEKKKFFLLSIASFLVSLLFKEISLFLLLFLPFFWLIHHRFQIKQRLKPFIKQAILFFSIALGYLFLRFLFFLGLRSPQPEMSDQTFPPVFSLIYRLLTVPIKGLVQSFFSDNFIFKISKLIINLAYPDFAALQETTDYDLIAQTIGADMASFFLAVILIVTFLIFYKFLKKRGEKELAAFFLLSFCFILLASLPFIFVAGSAGFFSIFEPRNLYVINLGSSIIVAILISKTSLFLDKKKKMANPLMILLVFLSLLFHIKIIQRDLKELKAASQLRKSFLETIQTAYPQLPDKVIFFTESDQSYYGLPEEEKILPVQSGFGKMLIVWYQDQEQFPGCLYENQFLYALLSQGYKSCQGKGFGYFREYELLAETLKTHQLPIENVIAYSWQGETEQFSDISQELRKKLKSSLLFSQNMD